MMALFWGSVNLAPRLRRSNLVELSGKKAGSLFFLIVDLERGLLFCFFLGKKLPFLLSLPRFFVAFFPRGTDFSDFRNCCHSSNPLRASLLAFLSLILLLWLSDFFFAVLFIVSHYEKDRRIRSLLFYVLIVKNGK